LEAQAVGIPVIVSNVGGLTDIVKHDETGFIVPSRCVSGLRHAMECILGDRLKARDMGANGKNYVKKNFTREKNLEITERALGIG
jgi:glycosyltransferase involved in cell wall biosynthesis